MTRQLLELSVAYHTQPDYSLWVLSSKVLDTGHLLGPTGSKCKEKVVPACRQRQQKPMIQSHLHRVPPCVLLDLEPGIGD